MARALDVVGERWSLLIVRNLLLGPRRYSDLLLELPGITTNLLAKRLADLCRLGVLEREELPAPLSATVYRLAPLGVELEPVIMELGRWGGRVLGSLEPEDTLNIGWALLSMKRRYVGGVTLVAELDIDDDPPSRKAQPERAMGRGPGSSAIHRQQRFELAFSPGYLSVQQRAAVRPEVSVSGSLSAFRGWFFQGRESSKLVSEGALRISGSEAGFGRLMRALALS